MAKNFDDLVKRTTSRQTRERAAARAAELLEGLMLGELRKLAGKSQRQVAAEMGIRQPSLSKLEGQLDIQLSTLRRIVAALGGELDVIARFPNRAVRIDQFDGRRKHSPRPARRKLPTA